MVEVYIEGLGQNTLSIIKEAKKRKEERDNSQNPAYDKIWVVFDRDSFQPDNFDNAIFSAEALGYGCAWCNEAFEL